MARLQDSLGFYATDLELIVERDQHELAIVASQTADGGSVVSWIMNQLSDGHGLLTGEAFGALLKMKDDGDVSSNQAIEILAELVENLSLIHI